MANFSTGIDTDVAGISVCCVMLVDVTLSGSKSSKLLIPQELFLLVPIFPAI